MKLDLQKLSCNLSKCGYVLETRQFILEAVRREQDTRTWKEEAVDYDGNTAYKCLDCGSMYECVEDYNYCPKCGRKMEG